LKKNRRAYFETCSIRVASCNGSSHEAADEFTDIRIQSSTSRVEKRIGEVVHAWDGKGNLNVD
jgi:hypothetical protein